MSSQVYSSPEVIFLLGAGASVDAGMPTIKDLTQGGNRGTLPVFPKSVKTN